MSERGGRRSVLVTGFQPFGGSTLNPSQLIAQSLAEHLTDIEPHAELHAAVLPVDTSAVGAELDVLWQRHDPDIVIHFGESARAEHFTLERVALNLMDFDTPDNTGKRVMDTPIDPAGPAARFVTLPVRGLKEHLEQAVVPVRLSLSAGAYLCNQALYLSLAHGEARGGRSVGFVHVPSLPEQADRVERGAPTMPRDRLLAGAAAVVRSAVRLHL